MKKIKKSSMKEIKKIIKKSKRKRKTFKPGTVVVFEPKNFNQEWWTNLSEADRLKYYGVLGYGADKQKCFVFLCEIISCPGHCVLVDMQDQHIETMRHTSDFREATEDEL